MNSSKLEALFSRLLELAGQPVVLGFVVVGVPLILWASRSLKYRWWALAFWAFLLPLTPSYDWLGNIRSAPFPFNFLVIYGRQAALFVLIAMVPAAVYFLRHNRFVKVPPALWGLLVMNIVYCLRYIPTPEIGLALTRLVTYLLIFFFLAFALPRWLTDRREVFRYLSAGGVSAFLFAVACFALYAVSPGVATIGGRMTGLTSSPNYLGGVCGYTMPVMLGLSLLPRQKKSTRLLWIFGAALIFLLLAWTGSRTSLGMCALGVCVIFRAKLGRLLILGVPLVFFVYMLSLVFQDVQSGAERMASLQNTRFAVWSRYLEMWKQDIVFGNADLGMRTVENSYLSLAANAGIAGCVALLIFLFLTVRICFKLISIKLPDREAEVLRDIALAGIASTLGNSCFEATLLVSLSSYTFWIFLYFVLAEFVIVYVPTEQYRSWYLATQFQYQQAFGNQLKRGMPG